MQPTPQTLSIIEKQWWKLVKFGFRLLYNELAWTYDLVAWGVSLGQWRNWQRTALKHLNVQPGARVLDLAHGPGNLQLDLYAAGYQRVGYDLSPYMGRIAQRKLQRRHLCAPLVRGYAQQLPFAAESFDAIVSTFPTEFIIDSDTLAETWRVLRPGGRMVIVASGILTGGGPARNLLETAYRLTGQRGPWPEDISTRFLQAGFAFELVQERYPYSIAIVVTATRT